MVKEGLPMVRKGEKARGNGKVSAAGVTLLRSTLNSIKPQSIDLIPIREEAITL